MATISFDIFCQVIDNFGDAGVCLRLAKQLHLKGQQVKIYTDQPELFKKINQSNSAFAVLPWNTAKQAPRLGVVIEAFACNLPEAYRNTIKSQQSLWLNLEYLSAEKWVEDFHKMPSIQNDGAQKYFFFPGFTNKTGGLLRNNLEINDFSLIRKANRQQKIAEIAKHNIATNRFIIFLFAYPKAPLDGLQLGLERCDQQFCILAAGGNYDLKASANIEIINLPFIDQKDFDQLLWLSDLNFIRGEDSLAQSSWTGIPTIWQAYKQTNNTHLEKLQAWLKTYNPPAIATHIIQAWNNNDNLSLAKQIPIALKNNQWLEWQKSSQSWAQKLLTQNDLVTELLNFSIKKLSQQHKF